MVVLILLLIFIILILHTDDHVKCHKCGNKMNEYSSFYWCDRCGAVKFKDKQYARRV